MKENKCVLVCVTPQNSSERLIKAGRAIAQEKNIPLKICSVLNSINVPESQSEIMENLYQLAKNYNAEMTLYFNDNPAITAAVYAMKVNAENIVVGFPRENGSPFVQNIHMLTPKISVTMVDTDGKIYQMNPEIVSRENKPAKV